MFTVHTKGMLNPLLRRKFKGQESTVLIEMNRFSASVTNHDVVEDICTDSAGTELWPMARVGESVSS